MCMDARRPALAVAALIGLNCWAPLEAGTTPGREESAAKEEAEKVILESYLPAGASDEEIDTAIAAAMAETGATSQKQMGLVMKAVQAKLAGKSVDGKTLSDKVRSKLS